MNDRLRVRVVWLVALVAVNAAIATARVPTPGPRYGHEMVFDEARGVTVLFGGFAPDGVPKADTWLWDGTAWRAAASQGPSPRKWAAAAYDARRQVVVLHGGREGVGRTGVSLTDTWIWDGRRWSEVGVAGPPGRDHHRAAYDRGRDRVILFGGWNGERLLGDTWEWDGSQWTQAASEGPSPRAPFGLAYHEKREEVVLVGGQDLDGAYSDMWRWNGVQWSQLEVAGPGARGFQAMTYDPDAEAILLFGGRNGDELFNDLWSWSGAEWIRVSSDGPLLRGVYASAYDRRESRLVIHGSGDLEDGEWKLDSRTWTWGAGSGWRVVAGRDGR